MIDLSLRTNREILDPISRWLDDPDFLKKHAVDTGDSISWAEYKRNQRDAHKRMNREAQAKALRAYWAAVKRKKHLLREVATLIPKRTMNNHQSTIGGVPEGSEAWLTATLGPFSTHETTRRGIAKEFSALGTIHPSNILPWQTILADQIEDQTTFTKLPLIYMDDRKDKISKFVHLLQMDQDGIVELEQSGDDITIHSKLRPKTDITIKDKSGNEITVAWDALSDAQKRKIITDATECQIICKTG